MGMFCIVSSCFLSGWDGDVLYSYTISGNSLRCASGISGNRNLDRHTRELFYYFILFRNTSKLFVLKDNGFIILKYFSDFSS